MYNHGWVTAFIDQRLVMIDPTWGSWNTYENCAFQRKGHNAPHWFDASLHAFSRTHNIWSFDGTVSYDYQNTFPAPEKVYASTAKLQVNGVPVHVGAYTINGNNYFKFRDLGNIFSFTVGWEEATGTITIDT